MRAYLSSRLVQVGLAMFLLGSGPLLSIIAAASLGLWPDPNPNPIGPGILAAFTFWPSVICIAVGVVRVRMRRPRGAASNKRVKLPGALVLMEAIGSCPGGHRTFVHYPCAGVGVARSLRAIRSMRAIREGRALRR